MSLLTICPLHASSTGEGRSQYGTNEGEGDNEDGQFHLEACKRKLPELRSLVNETQTDKPCSVERRNAGVFLVVGPLDVSKLMILMDNHQRFIDGLWSTGGSSRGSTWISSQIWGLTYLNRKTCFSHSVFYPLSSHAFCLGRALFSAFALPVNVNVFNGKFVFLSGLRFSARRRHPPAGRNSWLKDLYLNPIRLNLDFVIWMWSRGRSW